MKPPYFELNPEAVSKWLHAVENTFALKHGDLISKNRQREKVIPRHLCFYLLRKYEMTWVYIGKIFQRDHATIIHGFEQTKDSILPFNEIPQRKLKLIEDYLKFLITKQKTQELR